MNNEMERGGRCLYLVLVSFALALGASASLSAATLIVTTTNDSGPGSLRDNIASAASGDVVEFSVAGTIQLASTISIGATNLTISGPGASQLAISRGGIQSSGGPILYIGLGANVTISGVTIENGDFYYSNEPFYGGGGIYNDGGTLFITDSTISNNTACCQNQGVGGGIFNKGTLMVKNSTFSGNTGGGTGGGSGGAIYNTMAGIVTMTNSTLSGNGAPYGGGIDNEGEMTVTNSTLSGNNAGRDAGGGILNGNGATLTLINSTLSANASYFKSGAGIANYGIVRVKGTILANSRGENCSNFGSVTSLGYNLSDDATCTAVFSAPTDKNNTAAGLDPQALQSNGGPTQTIALLASSPAVNAIPVAECTDASGNRVKDDQRGITRPQGPACDIGAFELKAELVPFSSFDVKLDADEFTSNFELGATLALGSGSTGLDPLTDPVTLQIANYSVTIPAGSFQQAHDKRDYVYKGNIGGVALRVSIIPLSVSRYIFVAEGSPVKFANANEYVPVSLTIGSNTGTKSVKVD